MLYEVQSLDRAESVFSDGAYVTVVVKNRKAFIEEKEIPKDTLETWAKGDDSAPVNHSSDFQVNGERINMVVPAAALVLLLIENM